MAPELILAPDGGYNRQAELKSFNDSKVGVKGLADAGLTKIPRFLVQDHLDLELDCALESLGPSPSVLVVDLGGAGRGWSPGERKRTVGLVREACVTWGFFQVVNHGMPAALMEEMVEIVKICLEFKPEANC